MKIKNGTLILGKKEREALKIIKTHTRINISYGEGGSFNKEAKNGEYQFDKVEAGKAKRGIEIIDFILKITEKL